MSSARGRFTTEEALSLIYRDVEDDIESGDDDDDLFELCSPNDFDDESNPDDAEDDSDDKGEEAESDCSSNSTSRGRPGKSTPSTGGEPRAKRLRTQQRLINSIDSALDPETLMIWSCPKKASVIHIVQSWDLQGRKMWGRSFGLMSSQNHVEDSEIVIF